MSMLDRYLTALSVTRKSENSVRHCRYHLKRFFAWLHDRSGSTEFTTIDVEEYRDFLINENLKPNSINTALTVIGAYCKWLVEGGYLDKNPVDFVERVQNMTLPPRWLSQSERYRVIRTALADENKRNTAIILLFLMAGLRVSELVQLTPEDVMVSDAKGSVVIRSGKPRTVPLNKTLREVLPKYLVKKRADSRWLFGSQRGEQLTPRGVQQVCAVVGETANVADLTPSVLRHTCGHDLVAAGVKIRVVAALMGISHPERIAVYAENNTGVSL